MLTTAESTGVPASTTTVPDIAVPWGMQWYVHEPTSLNVISCDAPGAGNETLNVGPVTGGAGELLSPPPEQPARTANAIKMVMATSGRAGRDILPPGQGAVWVRAMRSDAVNRRSSVGIGPP